MVSFKRILCPADYSDCSRHALDQAIAIAQWSGGAVTALHVLELIPYAGRLAGPVMTSVPEDVTATREELRRFVAAAAGDRAIDIVMGHGPVAATIINQAAAIPADLLVLGTHGRSGFEHLLLGSVAERVLRKASCPVVTVPRRAPGVVPAGPVLYRRILCATDFSPAADRALRYAEALAAGTGSQLTVMHVVEPVSVYAPGPWDDETAMRKAAGEASLARISDRARGVGQVSHVVAEGKPYRQILEQATRMHADLIVIGIHDGVADRFHFGSTANHIVRAAECPVLSLRA